MAEDTNNNDQVRQDQAQQTDQTATPTPTTTPNQTTTVGQTQGQANQGMGDAEALRLVSPTVTMGQVASAAISEAKESTGKTAIENSLNDRATRDENLNKTNAAFCQQADNTVTENKYNRECYWHKYYIKAMQEVKQKMKFTFNNKEYRRINDSIYVSQNNIPVIARKLSDDETNKLEHEMAEQLWDPALNSNVNGPGDAVAGALATALLLGLKNATALAIIGKSAASFVTDSVSGLGKNYLREKTK